MRIGLAQMDIVWENTEKNKAKAAHFFERAAREQVDCLVFPEMTLVGFSMQVERTARDWEAQRDFFRKKSAEYGITTVFGYPMPTSEAEREAHPDWKHYRNYLGIAENGAIRMNYAKIHPFTFGMEGRYYQGGEEIFTIPWKNTTVGAFICYDLRFPEIFQISSKASEIIFVIANWPAARIAQWDQLLAARAVENLSYVVGVNRTGEGGGLVYNGHSAIYGPSGECLTKCREDECLLIADLDLAALRKSRKLFPVKNDRREELYMELYRRHCKQS